MIRTLESVVVNEYLRLRFSRTDPWTGEDAGEHLDLYTDPEYRELMDRFVGEEFSLTHGDMAWYGKKAPYPVGDILAAGYVRVDRTAALEALKLDAEPEDDTQWK